VSGAAAIAALPPPTAPPAGPVGAGEPEATPLTVSPDSNACFGWEVQRKAGLMHHSATACAMLDVERAARRTPGARSPSVPPNTVTVVMADRPRRSRLREDASDARRRRSAAAATLASTRSAASHGRDTSSETLQRASPVVTRRDCALPPALTLRLLARRSRSSLRRRRRETSATGTPGDSMLHAPQRHERALPLRRPTSYRRDGRSTGCCAAPSH
jgi:hypothetical protein